MNKKELLQELAAKIQSGELQKDEVVKKLGLTKDTGNSKSQVSKSHNFSITKLFYVLGAAVALVGILFFIAQIWDDIGPIGRISVTLGLGIIFAGNGSVLLISKPEEKIGSIFHILGGLLVPSGAMVTLSELHSNVDSLWPVTITFGFIFAFYFALTQYHKNPVLSFFAIGNGTAFLYLVIGAMLENTSYSEDIFAYLTMVVGLCYLSLAHGFRTGWNKELIGMLNFFGSGAFLIAAFTQIIDSIPWQILYIPLVIGSLFLAVELRSKSVLVMGTACLIAYIGYITSEYFADSIGWPISLVLLGFVFIGLGYVSVSISKKYMK